MNSLLPAQKWESKAVLQSHLESEGVRRVLVGATAEAPRRFYSFRVASAAGVIEVGVYSSGLGSTPALLLLDHGRQAIVGHDAWLTWIDVPQSSIATSRRLRGVFFEFLTLECDDEVVILHELGAIRVTARGSERWAVDTDIVEGSRSDSHGNVILKIIDQAAEIVVSLESGKTLRP